MAIFFIERAILIFANAIIEPFFSRSEQKNALSGYFYKRHPVDYKIFIFLGQPLNYLVDIQSYCVFSIQTASPGDEHLSQGFVNTPVAVFVGVGQNRTPHVAANTHRIQVRTSPQTRLDVSKLSRNVIWAKAILKN